MGADGSVSGRERDRQDVDGPSQRKFLRLGVGARVCPGRFAKLLFEALWSEGSSCKHLSWTDQLGCTGKELRELWDPAPQLEFSGKLNPGLIR